MAAAVAAVLGLSVAGCGGGDSPKAPGKPKRSAPAQVPPVLLAVSKPPASVADATVTIQGRITPGAKVVVEGKPATPSQNRFRVKVPLALGKNRITIEASKAGFRPARKTVIVKRAQAPGYSTPGGTTPYRDRSGSPAPNPNCPPGTAPSGSSGGCAPYNENKPPPEPKINNPDCYKPNPPAGCF
jgi:hypothetical protein